MRKSIAIFIPLLLIVLGCQPSSSATPASSRAVDIRVDAPGVKVDVQGQKRNP